MKVFNKVQDIQNWRRGISKVQIGFVPTMGALHQGHIELLRQARRENEQVVLSIFVNPTQFNDPKDLEKYPRTLSDDLQMAEKAGVDVVWTPSFEDMYPDQYRFKITESDLSQKFCGAHRPGHFDGVLTVVMKLLQVVSPDRAYFGEKDYQQLSLIREMASAFFLPTKIVPVATVRESDGLAMSSRNVRLTAEERKNAPLLNQLLRGAKSAQEASQALSRAGFKVDYVEDFEGRRLAAAWLGNVRLIDNVQV